jgi:hypothetical protein
VGIAITDAMYAKLFQNFLRTPENRVREALDTFEELLNTRQIQPQWKSVQSPTHQPRLVLSNSP